MLFAPSPLFKSGIFITFSISSNTIFIFAIARSFLKNSPIVLLDEATAYSDPDNEAIIQESINNLIKDKTVIMIAHRLSTIVNANKIIVVDNGRVIEQGSHKKLLELNGKYKEMWDVYTESKGIEVI